jgi:hypothetical protein
VLPKGRWIAVRQCQPCPHGDRGQRFDTSTGGDRWNQGSGPRWRKQKRKPLGFTGKYYPGF